MNNVVAKQPKSQGTPQQRRLSPEFAELLHVLSSLDAKMSAAGSPSKG